MLASSKTLSDSWVRLVAEIAGRWYGMACLGKKLGPFLCLTLTQMWSWSQVWCLLWGYKRRVQNCFYSILSCRLCLHMNPLWVLPMPRKPDKGSVCVTTASIEEKDLNCFATIQVTHSLSCGRETSQLFWCASILKFTFLELGGWNKYPHSSGLRCDWVTVGCLSWCVAM